MQNGLRTLRRTLWACGVIAGAHLAPVGTDANRHPLQDALGPAAAQAQTTSRAAGRTARPAGRDTLFRDTLPTAAAASRRVLPLADTLVADTAGFHIAAKQAPVGGCYYTFGRRYCPRMLGALVVYTDSPPP